MPQNIQVPPGKMLPSEAARALGCGPGWVRYLCDSGRLPSERGALGIRLIDRRAVEELARQREGERKT